MKRLLSVVVCGLALAGGGCGAQQVLLGTEGSYLLTACDALALPGERVELRARLQGGDLLSAQPGRVVLFRRNGELLRAAETDGDGVAAVAFAPPRAGDYRFTAQAAPAGLPEMPPAPQPLLIVCRPADALMVIVDLDKTLVASGFHTVLLGDPTPMAGSSKVLARLARTHTVIYLTHRPEYFGPKSKAWLARHEYPTGPVLMASAGGFLMGSGEYKTKAIADLRKRFKKIEIGIGDKVSDAMAYHDNGLKAFLILQEPPAGDAEALKALADEVGKLPPAVQVVSGWDQIDRALTAGEAYPPAAAEGRIREMIRAAGAAK